ncbi:MAG: ATP-dependent RecD-like DNA helicase [Clostridia bacterium]
MEIKGQISEIIYQNEINSYTIAEFETDEELTVVVGYLPFINKGDSLKLLGNFVNHPDYGRQFKIQTFEKIMPETLEALEKYLAGGIIKGVGPATSKRIVDKFGEETIAVLKFEPERLSNIRGISKQKAEEISEEFNEKWDLWQIVGFLEKFGITGQNSKKVYEKLGQDAISKIEKNPYILLDITYGVDFKKIDKMAMDLGIDEQSSSRISSAIKYSLVLAGNNGNSAVLYNNLLSYVSNLLGIGTETIEEEIINLKAKQELFLEEYEDNEWVYLDTFYSAEQNIAEKLIALDKAKNIKYIKNFKSELAKTEENEKIILSEEQKEAIKAVNENNVCVITGGPGTGKTTIIKSIIKIYEARKMKVVLCAPTGRAAKRMQEQTGKEATTIHRLLEIRKLDDENFINLDYPITPIDADVVIIDEMSMVDMFLMNHILKAIYLGTKLILVGDIDQLPSVGPGNVLQDIIESNSITTIELNKIFRQAAKSKIITNAHRVNNGETFIGLEEKDKLDDFFYINETSQEKMLQDVLSLCTGRLKKYGNYDFFKNIQVLTPTKKGMLGTRELNKQLQNVLNPKANIEKQNGDRVFRIGDRVMQVKNNYDIYWERKTNELLEAGSGIFNGELGIITGIDDVNKQLEVCFDDEKTVWYDYTNLDELEHSYSITIHKSQRK